MSQITEFAGQVVRALPEDLDTDVMHGWITNPESLRRALRKALAPASEVFPLTLEGNLTVSELVTLGRYDMSDEWIADELFPLEEHEPIERIIELVQLNYDPTCEEVLEEFARRGLERPTYEDALCFGIKHPEEQEEHFVVFFHELVRDRRGHFGAFVLEGFNNMRQLSSRSNEFRWSRHHVFAGIRK